MDFNVITDFISSVGFPIGVSCFCLFRLENSIKANTLALTELKQIITILKERE